MTPFERTVFPQDRARPMVWPAKDPNEVTDYAVDFSARLNRNMWYRENLSSDSIASATFTRIEQAGLTIESEENDGASTATVWLSGGTDGSKGQILCRVVTTDGRTLDQTVSLVVRAR